MGEDTKDGQDGGGGALSFGSCAGVTTSMSQVTEQGLREGKSLPGATQLVSMAKSRGM